MKKCRNPCPSFPQGRLLAPKWVIAPTSPSIPLSTKTGSSTFCQMSSILKRESDKLDILCSAQNFILTSDENKIMLFSYSPSCFNFFTICPMAMSKPLTIAENTRLSYIALVSLSSFGYYWIFIEYVHINTVIEFDTNSMSSDGACSGVWGAEKAMYRKSGSSAYFCA